MQKQNHNQCEGGHVHNCGVAWDSCLWPGCGDCVLVPDDPYTFERQVWDLCLGLCIQFDWQSSTWRFRPYSEQTTKLEAGDRQWIAARIVAEIVSYHWPWSMLEECKTIVADSKGFIWGSRRLSSSIHRLTMMWPFQRSRTTSCRSSDVSAY